MHGGLAIARDRNGHCGARLAKPDVLHDRDRRGVVALAFRAPDVFDDLRDAEWCEQRVAGDVGRGAVRGVRATRETVKVHRHAGRRDRVHVSGEGLDVDR